MLAAIAKVKIPTAPNEIRSFLGTDGCYYRFVHNSPISDCLCKLKRFQMTSEAIVLNQPDFWKRFFVQCDASANGVIAILYQLDDELNEGPIAFCRRSSMAEK